MPDPKETDWSAVAARAQAYQALHLADLVDKPLATRGSFLISLGVPMGDAATLLGTNENSLRVQIAKAKKKAASAQASKAGVDA